MSSPKSVVLNNACTLMLLHDGTVSRSGEALVVKTSTHIIEVSASLMSDFSSQRSTMSFEHVCDVAPGICVYALPGVAATCKFSRQRHSRLDMEFEEIFGSVAAPPDKETVEHSYVEAQRCCPDDDKLVASLPPSDDGSIAITEDKDDDKSLCSMSSAASDLTPPQATLKRDLKAEESAALPGSNDPKSDAFPISNLFTLSPGVKSRYNGHLRGNEEPYDFIHVFRRGAALCCMICSYEDDVTGQKARSFYVCCKVKEESELFYARKPTRNKSLGKCIASVISSKSSLTVRTDFDFGNFLTISSDSLSLDREDGLKSALNSLLSDLQVCVNHVRNSSEQL